MYCVDSSDDDECHVVATNSYVDVKEASVTAAAASAWFDIPGVITADSMYDALCSGTDPWGDLSTADVSRRDLSSVMSTMASGCDLSTLSVSATVPSSSHPRSWKAWSPFGGLDDSDDIELVHNMLCDNALRGPVVGTLGHVEVLSNTLDGWGNPIDSRGRPLPVPAESISCESTSSGFTGKFHVSTVVVEELA